MTPMSSLAAVVLCAGKGTRMKSDKTKLLHRLLGKPLFYYPVIRALGAGASPVVAVVGYQAEAVRAGLAAAFPGAPVATALQAQQHGTGHAVRCARDALGGYEGPVLICNGDATLLRPETLELLKVAFAAAKAPLAMVTFVPENPEGYGRVVRKKGAVTQVVEQKDATASQLKIREANAGVYLADAAFLWASLERLQSNNAQGELYLTDLIAMAAKKGKVGVVRVEASEAAGINDRVELASASAVLQERINRAHMIRGVTLSDPRTTYIAEDVELAADVEIGPGVTLVQSRLGRGVRVDQGCVVVRTRVGEGTHLLPYTLCEDADVGPDCKLGPFARLRPGSVLAADVHVGNFVETKKTRLGKGSKANHLSYLGDALIGERVNVGAGTITCNYDGVAKHVTQIGNDVFIGSDTQLVAPVSVGDGALIGAGTTVTQDVPPQSLVLSRTPQVVKEGWVARKRSGA
jgi:bifunctional UDP-N-acetylglucosamine pyrophosphorylase/glucosamine-1-phosphate N-acetyltransferase